MTARENHIAAARRMSAELLAYAEVAERDWLGEDAQRAMLRVCNAAEDVVDDGDFLTERSNIMHELRVTKEGLRDRDFDLLTAVKSHKAFNRDFGGRA